MAEVTFPVGLGGNGQTYDDADFANGGHRTNFIPVLGQLVAVSNGAVTQSTAQVALATTQANNAAASAASALAAPGTNATSTTSVEIGTGTKNFTVQTGKDFVVGMYLMIAYTTTPENFMVGQVTSYDSGTGALAVNVTTIGGSGTYALWTVSISAFVATERVERRTIFDSSTASLTPVQPAYSIGTVNAVGGGHATDEALVYSADSGLFVYFSNGANTYTSPDGETWTARSMPETGNWSGCIDYSNDALLFATERLDAEAAYSDDGGVTWTATSADVTANTVGPPSRLGDNLLAHAQASSTTAYWSDDKGASWTTATLPAARNSNFGMPAFAGLFAYAASTSAYYTSATGATGTWTSRSVPTGASALNIYWHPVYAKPAVLGDDGLYTTDDYLTWDLAVSGAVTELTLNGVGFSFATSTIYSATALGFLSATDGAFTTSAEGTATSFGSISFTQPFRLAYNGTLFLAGNASNMQVVVVDLTDGGPTGLFFVE